MSNDRLKFRAWHKKAETMVLWGDSDEGDIFPFYPDASDCQLGEAIVDPLIEVMQWTGLYDSEGAMIFEGDVVELRAQWGGFIGTTIFECGCFGVKDGCTVYTFQDTNSETLRIIGNIYESPDLMELGNA